MLSLCYDQLALSDAIALKPKHLQARVQHEHSQREFDYEQHFEDIPEGINVDFIGRFQSARYFHDSEAAVSLRSEMLPTFSAPVDCMAPDPNSGRSEVVCWDSLAVLALLGRRSQS